MRIGNCQLSNSDAVPVSFLFPKNRHVFALLSTPFVLAFVSFSHMFFCTHRMPNTRLKHGEAGATRKERYDACTSDDLKLKLGSQVADDATWCMVNYKQPGNEDYDFDHNGDTILSKSYMECDCTNPIYTRLDRPTCGTIEQQELFPDYNDLCPGTGTLIEVTKIECRFGHQYVLAEILPAGEAGGGNGTDTIVCTSPAFDLGVRVPLTITLNRIDFSEVQPLSNCLQGKLGKPCTFFQYLDAAPAVVNKVGGIAKATISSTFDSIRIQFDRATDMGGQQSRIADLYGSNQETSGCARFKFSRPPLLSLTLPTHIDLN